MTRQDKIELVEIITMVVEDVFERKFRPAFEAAFETRFPVAFETAFEPHAQSIQTEFRLIHRRLDTIEEHLDVAVD